MCVCTQDFKHSLSCLSVSLPGDLLAVHNAAFESLTAVRELFDSALSERWNSNLFFQFERLLGAAFSLLRPVEPELSRAGSNHVEPQYNGQRILGCSAHAAALELANLIRIGCWAAGDLRGLANALNGRHFPCWQIGLDPGLVQKSQGYSDDHDQHWRTLERRQDTLRDYLRSAKQPNAARLIEAMCEEARAVAEKRQLGSFVSTSGRQQESLQAPARKNDAKQKPQSRREHELRSAYDGATRLFQELEHLRGRSSELPALLRCIVVGDAYSTAIALVQTSLARTRKRRPVRTPNEKRATASSLVLALWRRVQNACRRARLGKCYNVALSLMPRRFFRDPHVLGRLDHLLEEAIAEVSYSVRMADGSPTLELGGRRIHGKWEQAWAIYRNRLRHSREFWRAMADVDREMLSRQVTQVLDYDPVWLKRELEEEFLGPLELARPRLPKSFRRCSSSKMRALLEALWRQGPVPLQRVQRTVGCSSVEALLKQKDRANGWMARNDLGWEIKKQGETLVMLAVDPVEQSR